MEKDLNKKSLIIGPGANGFKTLMGFFGALLPDLKFKRQHTLLCGDRVTVLSKITGTVPKKLPQGIDAIPFFPGIPLENALGKKFETMGSSDTFFTVLVLSRFFSKSMGDDY